MNETQIGNMLELLRKISDTLYRIEQILEKLK